MKNVQYFEATVTNRIEYMDWNETEQAYIGYDPDKTVDNGIVTEFTADTLELLIEKIERNYSKLKSPFCEYDDVNNTLVFTFDGEYHHSTPESEQIPFSDIYEISVHAITAVPVNLSERTKS